MSTITPGYLKKDQLVDFLETQLRAGAPNRQFRRLINRLAKRGIYVESVNQYSGYRDAKTLHAMGQRENERTFGITPGNSAFVAKEPAGSPHCYGDAMDLEITRYPRGMTRDQAWAELVKTAANLGITRPLYPRLPSEYNHFVYTGRIDLGPLSVNAKKRFRKYSQSI
jgi:hypothetical protein